jgi:hypothetical protein
MQCPEQIALWKAMSPDERWELVSELMDSAWRQLAALPDDERERRLALADRRHEQLNQAIVRMPE